MCPGSFVAYQHCSSLWSKDSLIASRPNPNDFVTCRITFWIQFCAEIEIDNNKKVIIIQGRRRNSVHSVLGHCRFLRSNFWNLTFLEKGTLETSDFGVMYSLAGHCNFNAIAPSLNNYTMTRAGFFNISKYELSILFGFWKTKMLLNLNFLGV